MAKTAQIQQEKKNQIVLEKPAKLPLKKSFRIRKIDQKITIGFLVVSIIPILIIIALGFFASKKFIEKDRLNQLEVIADLKLIRIERFYESLEEDMQTIQDYYNVKTSLPIVGEFIDDQTNPKYILAKNTLDGQIQTFRQAKGFLEFLLFDTDGNMAYTTENVHKKEELGDPLPPFGLEAVEKGMNEIYFSEIFKSQFAPSGFESLVTAPIYDFDDNLIGVVALAIDMGPVYDSVQDTTGLGKTGETTLGVLRDDKVIFLNTLRHDAEAALTREVTIGEKVAVPIQRAALGETGAGVLIDYRGEEVIAAWRPFSKRNWGMVTKIDTSEAFEIINMITMQVLFYLTILIVGILLLANYISKSISEPIVSAAKVAKKIGGGDLTARIKIKSNDEVGILANSLNQMADDLRKQKLALVKALEDVSEERDIGESQSKSILENTSEGIVVTDNKGITQYINPAFSRMTGFEPGDFLDKDFAGQIVVFDLKGKPVLSKDRNDIAIIAKKRQRSKFLLQKKDGGKAPVIVNAAPINVGNEYKGVVRIFHDYSEDLKIQKQKDDFFSIASHELRTPLTVISGNLSILTGQVKKKLSQDEIQMMEDVENSTDRLIKMVSDFLNVSRLDQGRLTVNVDELDACNIAQEVVKELEPLAKEKGLSLNHRCLGEHNNVIADEGFLKEILINLIGNSIKFTEKGGIKIDHLTEDDSSVFRISDTGMGISKEKQGLLFQRFQQAMDRTKAREAGGTGLGLFISREFAKKMGGDLRLLESSPKGSTFELRLPIANSKIEMTNEKKEKVGKVDAKSVKSK